MSRRRDIGSGSGEGPVPEFVGGYSILARLSNHKATAVFRAYDGAHHRDVCIKILTEVGAASQSSKSAMEREVTLTKKLNHPGLIEIHAYVTDQPRHFFVMEYFDPGTTLTQVYVGEPPPFPPPPLKPVLIQTAETLKYLHEKGIVHRDIKPENVLVNPDGAIKLIDLSVAQEHTRPLWKKLLGFRNKVVGTRTYMAPEQIQGLDVDARTDLYSFGVMMFELLAGRPPFTADKPDALLKAHLSAPVPVLQQAAKGVTAEVSQLVGKLMAKDPASRPQKADELIYFLNRIKLHANDP